MSAFIVGNKHINAMLTAWRTYDTYASGFRETNREYSLSRQQDLNELGQILVDANYRSVNDRYDEDKSAPRFHFDLQDTSAKYPPVVILKACNCYDYQACEVDDYEGSLAQEIVQDIRMGAIRKLPGYDDAPWEIR